MCHVKKFDKHLSKKKARTLAVSFTLSIHIPRRPLRHVLAVFSHLLTMVKHKRYPRVIETRVPPSKNNPLCSISPPSRAYYRHLSPKPNAEAKTPSHLTDPTVRPARPAFRPSPFALRPSPFLTRVCKLKYARASQVVHAQPRRGTTFTAVLLYKTRHFLPLGPSLQEAPTNASLKHATRNMRHLSQAICAPLYASLAKHKRVRTCQARPRFTQEHIVPPETFPFVLYSI